MNLPKARLAIVLGSGGVGKTTTSAALALAAAEAGLRTAVITIDPAKRLAQALGLEKLSNDPQLVERFSSGGACSALWLDTDASFDELILRYAGSPDAGRRITEHRLFRLLKNQLGGIEEYLGVERLLRLGDSGAFDLCVLDTPPSRHALDFLESPKHILRFFDEGVLKVFLKGDEESDEPKRGGLFSRIFEGSKSQAIQVFKRFLGKGFIAEMAEFLSNLRPVHGVFIDTARRMEAWVRSDQASFMGVTTLEPTPLDELRILSLELESREFPTFSLVALNKCLPASSYPATAMEQAIGREAARRLGHKHAMQARLRGGLNLTSPRCELSRELPQQMDRQHLLTVGRTLLASWPEFHRLNSSPKP